MNNAISFLELLQHIFPLLLRITVTSLTMTFHIRIVLGYNLLVSLFKLGSFESLVGAFSRSSFQRLQILGITHLKAIMVAKLHVPLNNKSKLKKIRENSQHGINLGRHTQDFKASHLRFYYIMLPCSEISTCRLFSDSFKIIAYKRLHFQTQRPILTYCRKLSQKQKPKITPNVDQ